MCVCVCIYIYTVYIYTYVYTHSKYIHKLGQNACTGRCGASNGNAELIIKEKRQAVFVFDLVAADDHTAALFEAELDI